MLFCTLDYFPVPAGGAERQARLQAEALVRRGYEVTVVCPRSPGARNATINGVRVVRLPCLNRPKVRLFTYVFALAAFLLLRMRSFDLTHVHLANEQADVVSVMGWLLRRPVYLKLASGGAGGEVSRLGRSAWLTRYAGLRLATRIQALSDEIGEDLDRIGIDRQRVVRIPNGLDTTRFRPATAEERTRCRAELDLPPEAVLVVFVGRFAVYKGVGELLAVWQDGGDPPAATLVLVGTVDTDEPVGAVEPSPGVIVRGWAQRPIDYYHAADVLALPSHYEGMSNALLEALGCGLTIVASGIPANAALIEDGVNGLLVTPRSVQDLRAAIARIAADPALRARLADAAAATAQDYSIEVIVERITREYETIVS